MEVEDMGLLVLEKLGRLLIIIIRRLLLNIIRKIKIYNDGSVEEGQWIKVDTKTVTVRA